MNTYRAQLPLFVVLALGLLGVCQAIRLSLMSSVAAPMKVFDLGLVALNIVPSENRGVNFGLFADDMAGQQFILAGIALAVVTGFSFFLLRKRRTSMTVAAALVAAGGLSNAYERITIGYVFDYINSPVFGIFAPYSYNVADIFIFLPLIWLVLRDFFVSE